jgi:hypothetical protein
MLLCYARDGMLGVCKGRWARPLVVFSQSFGLDLNYWLILTN